MKSYTCLNVEIDQQIETITINRPKALNALNSDTMEELTRYFQIDVSPRMNDLKGIIITGAGDKAFVAGADINDFLGLNKENIEAFVRRGHHLFNMIEQFSRPVVAAIHGFALGGGCELAMACHLRVATTSSRFGQPEVNLGILPGYGGTQRLVQLIGKSKALQYLLTAELISADEAAALGLVNQVVEDGAEVEAARVFIQKISKKGPLAIRKTIAAVNAHFDKSRDGFEEEIQAFMELSGTEDFKEGATAFLEKRKPNFVGK